MIWGNTISTSMMRSDFNETNPSMASFILNNPSDAIQKAQRTADDALPKSGGNMSGDINMAGHKVTGLAAPSENFDAASKEYVDTQIRGVKTTASATLLASGWVDSHQTVAVAGVTADNIVLVTPAPNSYVAYGEAVVYCSAQTEGHLTFACGEVPTDDLTANILIMN